MSAPPSLETLPRTLVELLRRRAEASPDATAYCFLLDGEDREQRLTYGELDRRARSIAASLGALGARGERALLLYPPGLEYIAAFFGCLYAGAVAVPVYPPRPNRPMSRLLGILADSGARAALATGPIVEGLERGLPGARGMAWLATDRVIPGLAGEWRDPGVGPGDLAFLQYTSGSTAAPKGVMLSHRNLLANLEMIRRCFGQRPDERAVIWLPPYHDMGLIGGILEPLYVGYPVTLMSPVSFLRRPLRWLQAVSRVRATTSGGPDFAYDLCARKADADEVRRLDLSCWELAFNGAEPIRAETLERFAETFAPAGFRPQAALPCYGLAEATLLAASGERGAGPRLERFSTAALEQHRAVAPEGPAGARTLVGCGRSPEGQELRVVDPETREPLEPGRVGELWLRGPSVAQGYWGHAGETAETFGALLTPSGEGPFLRTGDLGFVEGGQVFVTGRSKDLIIIRGRNHYPQDIEASTEASHRALRPGCGAAFAVDAVGGEGLVVVHEVRRDARDADPEEVAEAIRRAVADEHEIALEDVVLLRPGSLPKTSSGKVRRRACREAYETGTLAAVWQGGGSPAVTAAAEPAAATGEEAWLIAEVAARTGVPAARIDPTEPLDRYPLDSLAAMELMHALETRLGVNVSLERFFEGVSIAELVAMARPGEAGGEAERPPGGREVGEHPLSQSQLSLWFLHLLDPGSPAYNVPGAVRIRGRLDAGALQRTFELLVRRHPALRTTFVTVRGEPRQRVHESIELPWAEQDARGWSGRRLSEFLAAEARRPFDLTTGPLLRAVLLRRSALDHVLLVVVHHAVTDFWSQGVLLEELAALYPTLAGGGEPRLPAAGARYSDHARRQREMLEGPRGQALWAYWRERLGGELPVLSLHTDRPRPRIQSHAGATCSVRLAPHLTAALNALGRRRRATPFMTLAAAFEVLLSRYSGHRDLLLGTVSAARTRASLARTVGYFVNPLVLRGDLSGDPPFTTVLDRARRDALGAFEHQDYPFPLLVERLKPERDPGRSPLFEVMLVLQKAQLADGQDLTGFALGGARAHVDVGGLRLEPVDLPLGIAQFDLTLTAGEVADAYTLVFDYNVRLFDAATVSRMAAHFQRLLQGIVEAPGLAVADLPLLTDEERRQLLLDFNDTRFDYPRDATLADLFEEQAAKTPDAAAVLWGDQRRTYLDLDRRTSQVARFLQRQGVGPETVVGLCLERSIELLGAVLGVLKAGGAYLPLAPDAPAERLAYTLGDAGARLILTQERLRHLLPAGGGEVLYLDSQWEAVSRESGEAPPRAASAGNLACVIYTSGSTGRPKGVLLDHRCLVNMVCSFIASYAPGEEDRVLPLTSTAHASFVGEIFPALCCGAGVVLPKEEELLDTWALLGLMARRRVTIASTVPAMLANLNALRDQLPELRMILVGGEALSAGDVDRLLEKVRIVNGYGLTETAVCSTYHTLAAGDLADGAQPAIGKPVINTRVYVLDRRLESMPVGVPGELYIAGDGLARAYLGNPGLTAARFLPDPHDTGRRMYRSGDLAVWSPAGELRYLGRADQQVKIRGFRIEPGEIESVLTLHPQVLKAVVMVRRDPPGTPKLVAYVVPGEKPPTGGELTAYLHERLPDYMVPAALVFLEELPLRPSGKVDLSRLPAPAAPRPAAAPGGAPRSELERRIAGVWQEALKLESVGLEDNFFDLGGHSLLAAKVHARLGEVLGRELSLVDLFRFPTVGSLARHLSGAGGAEEVPVAAFRRPGPRAQGPVHDGVAVVGLAGRFPGAGSPEALWRNVTAGVESIRFFSDDELLAAGVDPELVADPAYVKAKGILGDVDLFDAAFFGLNPREVELMDPQHRLFLECCWEALEHAGYDAERYPGRIGVYGGESMNTYLLTNLLPHLELVASADTLQASLGNDKDPLTSRVAYKLNLKGPSVTVQTASSTSLAAVHLAVRSLLCGDCDMALAGGVSIHLPEVTGYRYQEGGTTSMDGHCRAFDAAASGFVSGHGAGVVVLKRLTEARADRDTIHATILGSACNNDGSMKVSFMAPSVEGQVAVYARAYEDAGVSPASVGYVECHGTGTALGDPIEITALSQVYGAGDNGRGACAIGSLKTNIGHLDTAAGVSGLIKATLALREKTIPPTLHYRQANPQIDFAASPFFVNTELRSWERGDGPRRAAVTSLGMGGTNVHVVLEEAPEPAPPVPSRPCQLLLLSARSETALEAVTGRLAEHLGDLPDLPLADVAFTLQTGRRPLPHRRMLLCRDLADAAGALARLDPRRVLSATPPPGDRPVAFLLSGQGAQYPGMARGLYDSEMGFRADVDLCAELLEPHLGFDLRDALFADGDGPEAREEAARRLRQTEVAQPALFTVSYATARLWMSWGVRPAAMLGHSIGEVAAACLAGVMSVADALALVAVRGRLMQQMPPGAMLGVPLAEAEVTPLLPDGLSVAVVNRPGDCVVSGPVEAVEELEEVLSQRGLTGRRLHTSHAYHSQMMEPILPPFLEQVKKVRLEPPAIPYLSNVTGTWIRPGEATDPAYWVRHLRRTVRFSDGLAELFAEPQRVLLEVGPGNQLATLARQHPARGPAHGVFSSIRHPKDADDDLEVLVGSMGRLWLAGVEPDWSGFYRDERRSRVPLPTYPFERRRYWVEPPAAGTRSRAAGRGRRPMEDWFYAPVWRQTPLPSPGSAPEATAAGTSAANGQGDLWLLFLDGSELGEHLAGELAGRGCRVVRAQIGDAFAAAGEDRYRLAPGDPGGYDALVEALAGPPAGILHLWGAGAPAGDGRQDLDGEMDRCFYSLVHLARALGRAGTAGPLSLGVVTAGLADVTGGEALDPLRALALGPVTVLPREVPGLICRLMDVEPATGLPAARQLLREMATGDGGPPVVAFRRHHRWVPDFEAVPMPGGGGVPPLLRPEGVYLVTGGLGGMGLALAEHLARTVRARLVLTGRSPFPAREAWEGWLAEHGPEERVSRRILRLQALEEAGARVLALSADAADRSAMAAVKAAAEERFGPVHGVIHAAGVAGGGFVGSRTREETAAVLAPKVRGTLVLEELFAGADLDFLLLTSSITAVLPQPGQADYVAANAFLDAFAVARAAREGPTTLAVAWDVWREVGMAVETEVPDELKAWRQETLRQGIAPPEGQEAFARILAAGLPRVVVSTTDLAGRLEANHGPPDLDALDTASGPQEAHDRPALANPFVPPASDLERGIAAIWEEMLGIAPVGLHDNFFELGGNSLVGLRVTQRIKERLDLPISDLSLYEGPTVAALAALLDDREGEGGAKPGAPGDGPRPASREEASRSRGERRKARLERKRGGAQPREGEG